MEIVEMTPAHEAEYAETFKDVYFPYTLGFKKFVEALGHETCYLLAIHDAKIVNAFCISKVGGSFYTPFGFPGGAINTRYIKELYEKAKEIAQGRGCYELAIIGSPLRNVQPPTQYVKWNFMQITDLEKLVYPRTIRKEINRARRIGFMLYNDHHVGRVFDFHRLCETNIKERKESTTHNVKFIEAAIKHLGAELWTVYKDNELRAGVLFIESGGMIDYFMVGQIVDEEKRKFALEFLIDSIIDYARFNNFKYINWQGSCDSGTEFFKSQFRAEKVWYPIFYHPLVEWRERELKGGLQVPILEQMLRAGTKLGEFWLGKQNV